MTKAVHCLSCSFQHCFGVEYSLNMEQVLLSTLQSVSHMCQLRALEHLHNVETRLYCPQTFLILDF